MSLLRRLMNRNMTLYDQLDTLATCGIALRDSVGPAELLARHTEREYETTPFKLLLTELGRESEEPPYFALSADVWLMHADCVTHSGDYAKVANRMAALSHEVLDVESVRDEFDMKNGVAWLMFTLRGEEFRWLARGAGNRVALHLPRSRRAGLPAGLRYRAAVRRTSQDHRVGVRMVGVTACLSDCDSACERRTAEL